MRVIELSDVTLISSNVAISTYAEYDPATTYSVGENVRVSFESDGVTPRTPVEEYTSLAGSNTDNYPPDDPVNWKDDGSENRWKMFDEYTTTHTENTSIIEIEIDASGIDVVGLFNLVAKSVTFELSAYGSVKVSETIDLFSLPENSWYSYFFNDVIYKKKILWDLPSYAAATLKITIEYHSGETVECGMATIGKQFDLGAAHYEPSIELKSYSIEDTDTLGRTYLKQGNKAKEIDIECWMDNNQIDNVFGILENLINIPVIFDCNNGDTGYLIMSTYGFFKTALIIIPGHTTSKCLMNIKGLI